MERIKSLKQSVDEEVVDYVIKYLYLNLKRSSPKADAKLIYRGIVLPDYVNKIDDILSIACFKIISSYNHYFKADRKRHTASLKVYVRAAVINGIKDYISNHVKHTTNTIYISDCDDDTIDIFSCSDDDKDMDDKDEIKHLLGRNLTLQQARIVYWYYIKQIDDNIVAKFCNIDKATIRKIRSRALSKLKEVA